MRNVAVRTACAHPGASTILLPPGRPWGLCTNGPMSKQVLIAGAGMRGSAAAIASSTDEAMSEDIGNSLFRMS